MAVILVVSAEPRAGRSTVAAAIAWRAAQAGTQVTLARLEGDDGAQRDAAAFAALRPLVSPGAPIARKDVKSLVSAGDVVLEAPPGPAAQVASSLKARVIVVRGLSSPALDIDGSSVISTIVTNVPDGQIAPLNAQPNTLALPEDSALAAPSLADVETATGAQRLIEAHDEPAIERVMIGTVASDAAGPYFGNRRRTCVITRYDKTDIQLAALGTDLSVLLLTGGGEPSPYLIDRVQNGRDDVAVLLTREDTVSAMRAVEPLFGGSAFSGVPKLRRAAELLEAAGMPALLEPAAV